MNGSRASPTTLGVSDIAHWFRNLRVPGGGAVFREIGRRSVHPRATRVVKDETSDQVGSMRCVEEFLNARRQARWAQKQRREPWSRYVALAEGCLAPRISPKDCLA